jgi:hypothetical protein
MSHHYSGPDWGFSHRDARLDLTYPYAFPKPGDAGKSILIMNVHPSVRDSTARTRSGAPPSTPSHPRHCTSLSIDTDGDGVADIAYRVRFFSSEGGAQTATLRRVEGAGCRDGRRRADYRRGGAGLDGGKHG